MTTVPVVHDHGTDLLDISASLRRGSGRILVTGPVSTEVEDEIQKSIRFAAQLADLGEFEFPNLASFDLRISFTCRLSGLPISGTSYGLGLGCEILRLFSSRDFPADYCYSASLDESGSTDAVGMLERKRLAAAREGYRTIFVPAAQFEFFCPVINQVPVESIFQAWGVLNYGS